MKTCMYIVTLTVLAFLSGCAAPGTGKTAKKYAWADTPGLPLQTLQMPPQAEGAAPFCFRKVTNAREWQEIKYRARLATFAELAPYVSSVYELIPVRVAEGFIALTSTAPKREGRWRFLKAEIRIAETNAPPSYYVAIKAP